ncbi:MAG: hypothetical protein IPP64_11955 [Bacteroidetes bacterium]|nr:hypothetical protein [Bacteroidota bacterium]
MPALKANAGYQFLFKLERKYSGHELRVINLEQKKVLLNSIRDDFKTIYRTDPGQTMKRLDTIYSENLDKWINVLYSKNRKDKDGKSKIDFQYSKEKKIEFESENRNVVSNLDWSKLANEMAVIKGELNGQAEYSKKIMKSWTVFRQDLNNFIDPKNKTEFEFPENPWILEIINGVDGDQNIKKAMLGKYNIKTDKPASFDDLETKLDSASVEEMYTNQKAFLEKLKTEYTTLEALNRNKKGWLTFSNILKQLYAEVLAYYNSTSVLRESYYKLTGQIDLLDAKDVLNYIDIKMPVAGSTIANFMTRAEYYITADIGIAYGMFNLGYSNNTTKKWDEVLPYTGVNFNLASINRQARYRYRKYKNICNTPFKSWWYVQSKKISIVSGVTIVSVEKTVNDVTYRKGLVGTSQNLALLSGVAYRLGDYGRISGGFVFSKQRDQNLLIEDYHLKATPYVSISLDLDVKKYIKNLTDLIFPGNE